MKQLFSSTYKLSLHRVAVFLLHWSRFGSMGPDRLFNKFIYRDLPESGFGDRLGIYLSVAALGESLGKTIHTSWHKDCPSHTAVDKINDINRYCEFPSCLVFENSIDKILGITLPDIIGQGSYGIHAWDHGFDLIPELTFKMWENAGFRINKQQYLDNYQKLASHVKCKFKIDVKKNSFIALHVRRGDKVKIVGGKVSDDEEHMNMKIIRQVNRGNKLPWRLFSDCEETKRKYASFLSSEGIPLILDHSPSSCPNEMIKDFFTISLASGVVSSSPGNRGLDESYTQGGWTSFSYIASRINNIPLLCTYPHIDSPDFRYERYRKANNGERISNVFYHDEVDQFLSLSR